MPAQKPSTEPASPLRALNDSINTAIGALQRAAEHADDRESAQARAMFAQAKAAITEAERALRAEDAAL